MSTPQCIAQFAQACKDLTNDQIYNLFEYEIKQELCEDIYDKYSTSKDNEPMRAAMNRIGAKYNIESLKSY